MLKKLSFVMVGLFILFNPLVSRKLPANPPYYDMTTLWTVGSDPRDQDSDPFDLLAVRIVGTELVIKVRYRGCSEHKFELEWPEIITMAFPPTVETMLYHDDMWDTCEMMIVQELRFDIEDSGLGLSPRVINDMRITVVNGSDGSKRLTSRTSTYSVP